LLSGELQRYTPLCPGAKPLFAPWPAVMAANFLVVSLPEERPYLLRQVEQGLGKL